MTGTEISNSLGEAADCVPYVRDGRHAVKFLLDKHVMTGDTVVSIGNQHSWVGTKEFAEHSDDEFESSYVAGAVVTSEQQFLPEWKHRRRDHQCGERAGPERFCPVGKYSKDMARRLLGQVGRICRQWGKYTFN